MSDDIDVKCSFCGKTNDEVEHMVASPTAVICDSCIMECLNILVYGEPEPVVINLGEADGL